MKKYKNDFWSLTFYIIAVISYYSLVTPINFNIFRVGPGLIFTLLGIFFGLRSIKSNKSSLVGYLMVVVGGIVFALQYPAFIIIFLYGK